MTQNTLGVICLLDRESVPVDIIMEAAMDNTTRCQFSCLSLIEKQGCHIDGCHYLLLLKTAHCHLRSCPRCVCSNWCCYLSRTIEITYFSSIGLQSFKVVHTRYHWPGQRSCTQTPPIGYSMGLSVLVSVSLNKSYKMFTYF